MKKSDEKEMISDYKKIVTPNKQSLFVNTEWQVKNGIFKKFSLYTDSCNSATTTSTAKSLADIKM